jgi:hypothetical protein
MGFASGFVTGLAKTVDDQLKNDMLRTQKRMDGMEQYRITRGRADIEREQKETREVGEVMKNLASLVGGDPYKAAQLYEAGGGTLSGATEFYQTTKKSQALLGEKFDINKVVTLLENDKPNSIPMSDYVKNYVQGANTQVRGNQDFEASGLLGKMFGGSKNYIKTMDSNVKKAVGTSENKFGLLKVPTPKINHEAFIEYKAHQKKNNIKSGSNFGEQYNIYDTAVYNEDDPKEKEKLRKQRDNYYALYLTDKKFSKKGTGTSTSLFSKEAITSIITKANNASVEGAGYTEGIGESFKILMAGNEGQVFEARDNAITGVESRFKSVSKKDEPILYDAIQTEKALQRSQREQYKARQEDNYIASKQDDASTGYEKYQDFNTTQSIISTVSIPPNTSTRGVFDLHIDAIEKEAKEKRYPPGKVIEYKNTAGNIIKYIWTGTRVIN